MTALSLTTTGAIHTGACMAVPHALTQALRSVRGLLREVPAPERDYCLHDEDGYPIGVIRAPAGRPAVGPHAPAVYLRRAG